MSELSRDARDLIARAKQDGPSLLGPSAQDRARVRDKLTPLWAAPVTRARRGWSLRVISTLLVAGLGVLGLWALRNQSSPPTAAEPVFTPARIDAVTPQNADAHDLREPPRSTSRSPAHRSSNANPQQEAPAPERRSASANRDHTAATRASQAAAHQATGPGVRAETNGVAAAPRGRTEAVASKLAPREETATRDRAAADGSAPAQRDRAETTGSAPPPRARTEAAASKLAPREEPATRDRADAPTPPRERSPLLAAASSARTSNVRSDARPGAPSIEGELELLSAAQRALQQQRPTRALSLLQEHAFRFPSGALSEERMAMQALALCASGRKHAALTVLSNLESRGASSQLLPRVRSECGL